MLSLQTCCRVLCSQAHMTKTNMCRNTLRSWCYKTQDGVLMPSRNISTSFSVNASVDKGGASQRHPKINRNKEKGSPVKPFTVFSAGASKKRSEMQPKVEARNDRDPSSRNFQASVPSTPLLPKEWSRLKEEYGRIQGFEEVMMAKLISGDRHIDVARSLLTFAGKESCGISYKLLLRYLALCVKQDQVTEIYDVYDLMKAKFKSFDTGAYSLFIKGFSQTDRWREAIALLETIKKTVCPSSGNYRDCIKGAVEHGEEQLALKLYKEMLQGELTPCDDTIRSLFNAGRRTHTKSFKNELLCILDYLRDNQIYPGEPLMESIKSWFESIPNESWTGQASSATHNGHCRACGHQLESIYLKPEEYDVLKDVFLNSVIKGPDTFRKTTPQELQDFQEFVNSRPPYDIVVDGLNVAHISPKGVRSQNLLDVVSSLASGGSRVLVLGRRHMLQDSRVWQRRHLDLLQQRADCFFLHNTSEDDPFLLYASLYSGNHCYFLTRDLMRDHKASLPDPQTRRLFFKWQRGHQLIIPFYAPGSKVYLQPTRCYDTILQSTDLSWHIPYDKMGVTRATFEVPETWLCLQKKH